jgi:hypothetical protein
MALTLLDGLLDVERADYTVFRGGNRQVNEELASDEIYYGPNPGKKERKFFKKKR